MKDRKAVAGWVRWVARIWSLLSLALILVFAVGEYAQGAGPGPAVREWVGLALWPIGFFVVLQLAWFRERLGGLLAMGFLAAFYVWNLQRTGHWPRGPYFLLFSAPAFLFLAVGWLSRPTASSEEIRGGEGQAR